MVRHFLYLFNILFICLNGKAQELPLKSQRTASFQTDEASCLDVDISPNGRKILFSFLGNLYSLPSKGGTAKQLTRGLAINRCPVWSPDGKLIAYESDASGFIRVHVMNERGSFNKALGSKYYDERLKLLFPDGKHVVVNNNIYSMTGTISLLPNDVSDLLGVSCNGRFFYYQEYVSGDSTAVSKLDRESGEKTRQLILNISYESLMTGKSSPNGNWLTYIKYADSLMAINLITGEQKLLAQLNTKFTGYLGKQHYSFSPDSKYLFIGYGGKIHRIDIETGKNEIIPFTANVKVDMAPLVYNRHKVQLDSIEVKYIRSAQKSPDGKHFLFSALNKIYLMDLTNRKLHVLADQPFGQFEPTYSPDGKWIAYVSWSDSISGQVWKIPSNGGVAEQITTISGLYQHPSWSLDGQMIAVVKGANRFGSPSNPGEGQIQVIDVRDKAVEIYADTVPLFNQPSFSIDGQRIIFKPNQRKTDSKVSPKLVSMGLDTKAQSIVATALNKNESNYPIRQIVLSADGRYLAFMYNEDLYLTRMINVGSSQMIFNQTEPITLIRFARGAIDPLFEKDGKILSWVSTNKYFRINPDKIIKASEYLLPKQPFEGLPQSKIIDVDMPADETITVHLKVPRLEGKGMIVLKNATVITMHGKRVIENGTVILKNGRFVTVGASNKISIPKEAEIFDLKGKIVMPGFIDMHSHMAETYPPDVFPQQSWQKMMALSYGVTTRRNPSGSFDEFGYNELVETGQMLGPRSFTVGHAVRSHYNLNSSNEAKIIVSNRKKYGATYIKQYSQPTRLQRQLLLEACRKEGVNMTNEVSKDPLYAIGMFKDGSTGVEHNPEWGDTYDDVIKLVAKSGTYLCPTLQVCYGREEGKYYFRKLYGRDFLNRSARFMSDGYKKELLEGINRKTLDSGFLDQSRIDAKIKLAGGKIVMGSHGEDQGIGAHWEIWALQMGGLTNHEALETATITAAEALGMQKDLGSIEVGKIADLIILNKNPLEDIHNTNTIKYVMKAGVLYDSETLDEIWPRAVKCPWVGNPKVKQP